ncbi:hypothetical protein [Streptomyces barringtoniae]|uniref:hypothetical protein n=1 Tax=Streptomyces barringtoniae TaxID=2892029 RepID=UPI001E29E1E3|nr:hypothetical protein [Streptomyces barringtoniae]MCC5478764.1 hypothetical protein [Streptomyces barringtoniae]
MSTALEDRRARRVAAEREKYRPSAEGAARLLLLIDTFSRQKSTTANLEGRTKLAKLDFFLRYPERLTVALQSKGVSPEVIAVVTEEEVPIDERMVRYRYGPWDPSYYSLLGSLIGRGLVEVVKVNSRGLGYRSTTKGASFVERLLEDDSWAEYQARATLLRRHFDISGENLKKLVYSLFPDIAGSSWGRSI